MKRMVAQRMYVKGCSDNRCIDVLNKQTINRPLYLLITCDHEANGGPEALEDDTRLNVVL